MLLYITMLAVQVHGRDQSWHNMMELHLTVIDDRIDSFCLGISRMLI